MIAHLQTVNPEFLDGVDAEAIQRAQALDAEYETLLRMTADAAIRFGQIFQEMKALLGHGNYGKWLQFKGVSKDKAARFINVSQRFAHRPEDAQPFGLSVLYELSSPSVPEEVLEEAIAQAKQGQAISLEEARRLKKGKEATHTFEEVRALYEGAGFSFERTFRFSSFAKRHPYVANAVGICRYFRGLDEAWGAFEELKLKLSGAKERYSRSVQSCHTCVHQNRVDATFTCGAKSDDGHLYGIDQGDEIGESCRLYKRAEMSVEVQIEFNPGDRVEVNGTVGTVYAADPSTVTIQPDDQTAPILVDTHDVIVSFSEPLPQKFEVGDRIEGIALQDGQTTLGVVKSLGDNYLRLNVGDVFVGPVIQTERGSGREEKKERVAHDYYPTPEAITQILIDNVEIKGQVFEPCAGHGAIASMFDGCLSNEPYPAQEFEPDFQCDATEQAFWEALDAQGGFDWAVTNPPYEGESMLAILRHAMAHARVGVAMLVRITYLEPCRDRSEWLTQNADQMRYFIPISPRPKFRVDVNMPDNITVAWVVWDKRHSWKLLGIDCPFKFASGWR